MNTAERKQRRKEIKAQHAQDELAMLRDFHERKLQAVERNEKAKDEALAEREEHARTLKYHEQEQKAKDTYGQRGGKARTPRRIKVIDAQTGEIKKVTTQAKLVGPVRKRKKKEKQAAERQDEYDKGLRTPPGTFYDVMQWEEYEEKRTGRPINATARREQRSSTKDSAGS